MTTITVDVKVQAWSGWPHCVDHNASLVSLSLYPSEALHLVVGLVEAMDYEGRQQAANRIEALLRKEEW